MINKVSCMTIFIPFSMNYDYTDVNISVGYLQHIKFTWLLL